MYLLLLSTLNIFNKLNVYGIWDQDPLQEDNIPKENLSMATATELSSLTSLSSSSSSARTTTTATATNAIHDQINKIEDQLLSKNILHQIEVNAQNILYFESNKELIFSLLSCAEHLSDVNLLTALVMKIKPLFPLPFISSIPITSSSSFSSSSTILPASSSSSSFSFHSHSHSDLLTHSELTEQAGLINILLSDICDKNPDRRAAGRLVLTFLTAPISTSTSTSTSFPASPTPTPSSSSSESLSTSFSTSISSSIQLQNKIECIISPSLLIDNDINITQIENNVKKTIQSTFFLGPSSCDFTSFLLKNCCLVPSTYHSDFLVSTSTSTSTSNSNSNIFETLEELSLVQQMVLDSLILVGEIETDIKVLFHTLKAMNIINLPSKKKEKEEKEEKEKEEAIKLTKKKLKEVKIGIYQNNRFSSAFVLLNLFISRPLTSKILILHLINNEIYNSFFYNILFDWMNEIRMIGKCRVGYLSYNTNCAGCVNSLGGVENLQIKYDRINRNYNDKHSGSSNNNNNINNNNNNNNNNNDTDANSFNNIGNNDNREISDSIFVCTDLVRMIFFVSFEFIKQNINKLFHIYKTQSKYTTHGTYTAHSKYSNNAIPIYTGLETQNIYCIQFIDCAAWILSHSTGGSYSRKVLVPLLFEILSSIAPLDNSEEHSPQESFEEHSSSYLMINSYDKVIASFFLPFFQSMSPALLLNLLSYGGNGVGISGQSGIPLESLKLILDNIDLGIVSRNQSVLDPPGGLIGSVIKNDISSSTTPSSSSSFSSHPISRSIVTDLDKTAAWQVLIKPFSAKKILKIQSELQPLLQEIIKNSKYLREEKNQIKELSTKISEKKEDKLERKSQEEQTDKQNIESSITVFENEIEKLRLWALQSTCLSNLFTLNELRCDEKILIPLSKPHSLQPHLSQPPLLPPSNRSSFFPSFFLSFLPSFLS